MHKLQERIVIIMPTFEQKPEKFQFPKGGCRAVISGCSGSGKTELCRKIIEHRNHIFQNPPDRIIWLYKWRQAFFNDYKFIDFTQEFPVDFEPTIHTLLIADDIILEPEHLQAVCDLFIRGRHLGISVILLSQATFLNNPHYRLCQQNATHLFLFKAIRGRNQIETIGRQIFSRQALSDFLKAYADATQGPYGYLLIIFLPQENYRLRTNILPNEEETIYQIE
jgi:hypothetical protein